MEQITGTLNRIRFAQDGFLIGTLVLQDQVKNAVVKGTLLNPQQGETYTLQGEWISDPKWGKQFDFSHYETCLPKDTDGIVRYLMRTCKWIGPTIARKIVKAYGQDTLEILKKEPERVAKDVKGITVSRAMDIQTALKANEKLEAAIIEVEGIVGGKGLPKNLPIKIVDKYKCDAPAKIKENPYVLTEFQYVGFPSADIVALSIDHDRESISRKMSAVIHILKENSSSGHTWMPLSLLLREGEKLIGVCVGKGIDRLLEKKLIVEEAGYFALVDIAQDEKYIAGKVQALIDKSQPIKFSFPTDDLADDQKAAVETIGKHGVCILTGAPGTGKTFTEARIIQGFQDAGLDNILICCPTGKAAKRATEVMSDAGLPYQAITIHRALEPEKDHKTNSFVFKMNEGNPLRADLIVVDEFSMVDTWLCSCLLRAIVPSTRLLIVGDSYQLPSVGPGSVLRDFIKAGIPTVELTEIKRNTGDIVLSCHKIKDGKGYVPSPRLNLTEGLNLRHVEVDTAADILTVIREIVVKRMPQRGYNPIWDVQVISPLNEKTVISCKGINEVLQEELNKNPSIEKTPFRIGDKVVRTKNGRVKGQLKNNGVSFDDETFVVNGDLGKIVDATKKMLTVEFYDPDRETTLKKHPSEHNLLMAYCMTCHRMQGSEAPVVIIPVHSCFGYFVNRPWIYTAISRAQLLCITVGQFEAVEKAIQRHGNDERLTRLVESIQFGRI